ncbi:MAG: hypothetical protein J5592_10415, partial [Clostridia bacterium]|nr:hypothetical protein [Clostridia bacterium]
MKITEKIKNKFSQGFGPAWAGSKLLFLPVIALALIVALLVVLVTLAALVYYGILTTIRQSRSYLTNIRISNGWFY